MRRSVLTRVPLFTIALFGLVVGEAAAQTTYQAKPFVFVGTVANCGVNGARIVTSAWLTGMGLPDNFAVHPAGKNAHQGLLLSKNGPMANCSSAGVEIVGLPLGGAPISGLGFDFRRGGHCGAGAPRFNVYTAADFSEYYFFGCASGVHTDAPQNAAEWERVRFSGADGFPVGTVAPFVFGATTVYAIEIVFDEGTDIPSPNDPAGVGLAVLDNILINNTLIGRKGNVVITP